MMDALVEDYFWYDELTQMEAEDIRHNITGSDTEVLDYRELDELISNVRNRWKRESVTRPNW